MQAMNQMFVIDIYLNKFKNHFCSINPRFFRYFACGLNGYVGMIDFNSHQWIKYGFVAFAVAIALASLLFSNKLVRELTIEERNKIEIWAKATEHLATETDNSDMNLVLRILQGNTTIPVILYDKSNRSFIVNNIKLPERKWRNEFSSLRRYGFHVVATIRCSISLALLFTKLMMSAWCSVSLFCSPWHCTTFICSSENSTVSTLCSAILAEKMMQSGLSE